MAIKARNGSTPQFIASHPAAETSAPDDSDYTPMIENTMKSLAPCVRAFSLGV